MKRQENSKLRINMPFEDAVRHILKAGPMPKRKRSATYAEIQREVLRVDGFVPKTCWIADVKRRMGLPVRNAPNRKGAKPQEPCPSTKVGPIRMAVLRLG